MADVFPLILGITILLASVISNKTNISVTVVKKDYLNINLENQ